MNKHYLSFSIVVFLFFFLPSIHSQEKEGDDGDQGEEHLQGGDRDGDGADESTSPVIVSIKGKAEASIAKVGWRLMREVDGKVIYEVQLRQRIEGKAGDWRHEAETAKTYALVDGLKPNTTYDVRIRGWIGGKAGKWRIHENAFKTSSEQGDGEGREDGERDEDEDGEGENGDHDKDKGGEGEDGVREGDEGDEDRDDEGEDGERDGDEGDDRERGSDDEGQVTGKPGGIKTGEVGEHSAVIWWSKPEKPKNAEFFYDIQLRKRINGKPTEWKQTVETTRNEIVLKELASGTLYEVRVRAWANKKPSQWRVREEAFLTKGEPAQKEEEARIPEIAEIRADDIGSRAGAAKWRLTDEMDAKVAYDVQIRTRIKGKAGEWKHEAETTNNSIFIDGLEPDTIYEIRVRPWANKKAGEWKILEEAFRTHKEKGDEDRDDEGGDGERDGDEGGDNGEGEKGARVVDGDGEDDKRYRKKTIQLECKIVSGNKMRLSWPVSNEQNVLGEQYVLESMDSLNNSKDNSKWKPAWTVVFRTKDKWVLDIPIKKIGMKFFRVRKF